MDVDQEEAMIDIGTSKKVEYQDVLQMKVEVGDEKRSAKKLQKEPELIDPRYDGFYSIQEELTGVRAAPEHQLQMTMKRAC